MQKKLAEAKKKKSRKTKGGRVVNLNAEILKLADEYEQYIIDCRRKVHTFAEIATKEVNTHAFIVEEAKKLGLEV